MACQKLNFWWDDLLFCIQRDRSSTLTSRLLSCSRWLDYDLLQLSGAVRSRSASAGGCEGEKWRSPGQRSREWPASCPGMRSPLSVPLHCHSHRSPGPCRGCCEHQHSWRPPLRCPCLSGPRHPARISSQSVVDSWCSERDHRSGFELFRGFTFIFEASQRPGVRLVTVIRDQTDWHYLTQSFRSWYDNNTNNRKSTIIFFHYKYK